MPQAPLASKEASLFRQVVKNYEQKQHKKGVKAADQILRKRPDHGDTQAMKALILNTMGNSEEGFALAKVALKNDMKSHVCWHVYGLLYRSQKNYEEAIKAYKFALNLEPESPQILRDLSQLQVQMRDYAGYAQSRMKMLGKRESVRQNWTALAVAHHLNGDLAQAEKVLSLYEGSLKMTPPKTDIEHNEALMYKNTIIAETGDIERALEHLESIEKMVLDRTALMELKAYYLLRLGRKGEAEKAYRALLKRNGELRAYYTGLEQALGLQNENLQARKELYASYAQQYERVDAARRVPLDFLEGDDFREAADAYLKQMLRRGVPSTFNNVKSLYDNNAKRQVIEELVLSYSTEEPEKQVNGEANGDINKNEAHKDSDHSRWERSVLYFLAQHYNYKLCRDLKKSSSYTDKLIELAPKTYDWHMTRARISKHRGEPAEAAKEMNHARELDTRDRYINTKCAKYQLRDNQNDEALKTMSKFTRNEVVGGTLGDLIEMQALWYLTEDGEAYARRGRLGLALKRFHTIFNIFETWHEDQFDFHSFSLRKAQIRAYIDMMRWQDHLRQHPYFTRPALAAIKIYLALHDDPQQARQSDLPNGVNGTSDPKALKKARMEEDKRDEERREADRKVAAKKSNQGQDGETKKSDPDPRGRKLVETKEPLVEAMKFLTPLLESSPGNLQAQLSGFEVYIRREKYYLALKCLLAACSISSTDPEVHTALIKFHTVTSTLDNSNANTQYLISLIQQNLPAPFNTGPVPTADLAKFNDDFLNTRPQSLPHILAHVRSSRVIDPSRDAKDKYTIQILSSLDEMADLTLEQGLEGMKVLKEVGSPKGEQETFVQRAVKCLGGVGRGLLEREVVG